jgi:soluble lytic murein transglycosylase-like protein
MSTSRQTRDLQLARIANAHGAQYSLRIITEARKNNVPVSLAFALVQQESGFRNVFGHDPTHSIPDRWKGTVVTAQKYKHYKEHRSSGGMQGVGPCQLTWYEYQDEADRLGGCWKPRYNIAVAMDHLGNMLQSYQQHEAIKRYNGAGDAAERYAKQVEARMHTFHRIFS